MSSNGSASEQANTLSAGTGSAGVGGTTGCPDLGTALTAANAATWQVLGEVIVPTAQGPSLQFIEVGTAWAVSDRLLATNAHVTEAFVSFANSGVQFERVIGVQAGTGDVVELLRQLPHPDFNDDPLGSPDVGLFTTREQMVDILPLAPDNVSLELGDEIQIVGFPGDVDEFITLVPGETVPQATSLNGQITALRTYDNAEQVSLDNLDIIQHQAPTTPGTSGSSMISCGQVVGVNNAGTVQLIATPDASGNLSIDRVAAASNNFAVHVRHVRELVELFEANALQGEELPVDAVTQGPAQGSGDSPAPIVAEAGDSVFATGSVFDPFNHDIQIQLLDDGTIIGVSSWEGSEFNLSGQWFQDGSLFFIDDAAEVSGGDLRRGFYEAALVADGVLEGVYFEEGTEDQQAFLEIFVN